MRHSEKEQAPRIEPESGRTRIEAVGLEPDLSRMLFWRPHQFADCLEDPADLSIVCLVLSFQLAELVRNVIVSCRNFTQPDERAHDRNIHLMNCSLASEH